ncbi:DNA-directed RNA polymerase specialized sigma24 family protein [Streptomyces griseochromogenes]|uniref:DNA-directed RNA polymerase specialized sigma24 family protein n=1 Tax=Streptomyces griseochromogenes TaxID=68214 RepID=A0A1B1AP07_9ACTN|nr:sigma-70 region 4 domain-containing protein [Streptomyces griseochromogenes]ANP48302.1 hypothetical protein AVL59_00790 [Streptomyces griseochromogenes]MBP2050762.1 DNA-directed RNA polymerase specialized sigma24 family protein [Streptomyces griseochromogenes]
MYDVALVAEIQKFGFDSPVGRAFEHRVVSHGLTVMKSWIASSTIWAQTVAHLGYRGESCWSREEALTLAYDSVATAWRRFKKNILEGEWDPAKSSLQTSFLNKCKIAFVEEYKKWRERSRPQALEVLVPTGSEGDGDYGSPVRSAEESVVERESVRHAVGNMPRRTAQILALRAEGYSREEIASYMGTTVKGVDSVISRWRKNRRGGEPHE